MTTKLFSILSGLVVIYGGYYLWNKTDHNLAGFIVSLLGLAIAVAGLFLKPATSRRTIKVKGSMRKSQVDLQRSGDNHVTDDRVYIGKDMEESSIKDKAEN